MKSFAEIEEIRKENIGKFSPKDNGIRVVVGMATCGISAGARPVYNTLIDEVAKRQLKDVKVTRSGCLGMCKLEPIVEVFVPGQEKVTYIHVDAEKAKNIVASHIVNGNVCTDYLITNE